MPVGYLVSVLFPAVVVVLALAPRPTGGPRATPAFVVETAANELPFLIFYWLAASTLLALAQGDVGSPTGWIAVALAVAAVIGLGGVVGRAMSAWPALVDALARGLDDDPATAPGGRGSRTSWHRTPWGRVLIAPVRIPPRAVRHTRNIAYGPAGRENLLDVYRNRSHPAGSPIFVYFHPGGFFSGRKSREARPIIDRLVREGWVCVSANYRLSRGGAFPKNLVDAKRVIVWIRDHADEYGADPETVVVAGGSAGAHLAATCALTGNDRAFQPGFERARTTVSAAIGLYGYYGSAPTSETAASSPADYLRADAPPFLVIHGERDPMVPAESARVFAEALRVVSANPVVYAELPGGQHNFDRFASIRCAAVAEAVAAFGAWVRSPR